MTDEKIIFLLKCFTKKWLMTWGHIKNIRPTRETKTGRKDKLYFGQKSLRGWLHLGFRNNLYKYNYYNLRKYLNKFHFALRKFRLNFKYRLCKVAFFISAKFFFKILFFHEKDLLLFLAFLWHFLIIYSADIQFVSNFKMGINGNKICWQVFIDS